jgi:hypothetical protein
VARRELTRAAGPAALLVTALLTGLVTAVGVSGAAYAAGSPPVTHPDSVTLRAGEGTMIDVADNDGDPDGDALQVCRIGPDLPKALSESGVENGDLWVMASRRAKGTYTFTYYVCDDTYLTAGTVTVHVRPPAPTLEVVPVGDAPPGRLRIVNTYKQRTFRCEWGPLDAERTDGRTVVRPLSRVVITVHEANLEIDCRSGGAEYSFGFMTAEARVVRTYSAKASSGGHAQTRWRSP